MRLPRFLNIPKFLIPKFKLAEWLRVDTHHETPKHVQKLYMEAAEAKRARRAERARREGRVNA